MAKVLKTPQPYWQNDRTAVSTENIDRVRERNARRAIGGKAYYAKTKQAVYDTEDQQPAVEIGGEEQPAGGGEVESTDGGSSPAQDEGGDEDGAVTGRDVGGSPVLDSGGWEQLKKL